MTSPLPGWYQDPMNPEAQKWWDGQAWTTYTLPMAAGAAPDAGARTAGEDPEDRRQDGTPAGAAAAPGPFAPVDPAAPGNPTVRPASGTAADAEGPLSYPGSRGYPGGQQQAYPPFRSDSAQPQGYTDPAAPAGNQAYQQGYAGSHPAYSGYQGYPAYAAGPSGSNPLALTGFILGIAATFIFLFPFLGTAVALAAGAFSAIGLSKQPGKAPVYKVFGIIGLVLGIITTLMSVLFLALIFSV